MNEPEILVFPDQAAGAIEAAGRVAASLADAVGARGRADWATTDMCRAITRCRM